MTCESVMVHFGITMLLGGIGLGYSACRWLDAYRRRRP